MDPWTWITTSTDPGDIIATSGMVLVALLFARDLILTKGQHERRVADLVRGYEQRIQDLKDHHSTEKAYLLTSRTEEKARADAATARVGDALEVGRAGLQMLRGIDQAAAATGGSGT